MLCSISKVSTFLQTTRPDNYDEGWYQDENGDWLNQHDWHQDEYGEWYYEDSSYEDYDYSADGWYQGNPEGKDGMLGDYQMAKTWICLEGKSNLASGTAESQDTVNND